MFPAAASGNVAPNVTITANAGSLNGPQGAAFDAKGDLWVANYSGQTIAEFTPSQLAASGSPVPAVVIPDSAEPTALAFDANGDLWATNAAGGIQEYTPGQLTSSGTPAVTITSTEGAWGLTFDGAGDLWVGTYSVNNSLVEYRPDQLTSSGSPAVTLTGLDYPENPRFDANGDLWFSAPLGSTVAELTPGQLTTSGSPDPTVFLTGSSIDLPAGLAFDTGGDLWAADEGTIGVYEYAPTQLTSTGSPTPADTIQGGNTTFANPTDVLVTDPPAVTAISPNTGSGGTTVTISGAGFDYGSKVEFGTKAASSVTYVNPYELRAVAPSGTGTLDVTVSTFAGTSATSAADQYTYPALTTATSLGVSTTTPQVGQQVTYTATVSPIPDGGTVTFNDGGHAITCANSGGQAVSTVTGQATCQETFTTTAGNPHSITASYSGDSDYAPSPSGATSLTVGKATTTTGASVSPLSPTFGSAVTYAASVTSSGGTPTGTVAFTFGSTTLCSTGALSNGSGTCSATTAPVGSDTITATYSGDSNFQDQQAPRPWT